MGQEVCWAAGRCDKGAQGAPNLEDSMNDEHDYDDRCDDEQREADVWNAAEDGCERLGIPFDPVAEGLVEEEDSE